LATTEYDVVIIGAGPAGLAAGLYAARARRKTILIEKNVTGGQVAVTAVIENYPGIHEVNGFDLGQQMQTQAEKYGMEMAYAAVESITPQSDGRHLIKVDDGNEYLAEAVIVTAGADYNRLGIPGEDRLTGYGVSYCATCDAAFFKDMPTVVVGGGDSALDEGLFVTRYASTVTVIHRRDELRAGAYLQERAFAEPKMNFIWDTVVEQVNGDKEVESLTLKNLKTGEVSEFPTKAMFVFIGHTPNSSFLEGLLDMDAGGHVLANPWMETNVPGIFVAGEIRVDAARQVITSAGDGATAAIRADHYITDTFDNAK
jgi:thioredoxin reductase (NADPH)